MAVREISEDKKKADDGRISVNRREGAVSLKRIGLQMCGRRQFQTAS